MTDYNFDRTAVKALGLSDEELRELMPVGLVHLGWWASGYDGDHHARLRYIDTFLGAAMRELQWFLGQHPIYSDDDVIPALYLCCHAIELSLKSAIELKLELLERRGHNVCRPNSRVMGGHRLSPLFRYLDEVCDGSVSEENVGLGPFLKKLDQMNTRNQNRYAISKDGVQAWSEALLVPIAIFHREFMLYAGTVSGLVYEFVERLDSCDDEST